MLVWLDTPLPEKVRTPLIAGPVSVEAATAVTPVAVTGSDELLLNTMVGSAFKTARPAGSCPSATLGVASRVVLAAFLPRDRRASSRIPQRGETGYFTPPP